ncbi:MAG: cytochrome ubiquinol oxidase subunit I [Proteobacteria bacterium]|nr:cytochrome ubiquinol oxidase subunit I [Pseudomonadota bacterium]
MEAMWETEPAPAGLTIFGIPDQKAGKTHFEVKIPYLLGIITNIKEGIKAYKYLQQVRENSSDTNAIKNFDNYSKYLGYALLIKKYRNDVEHTTNEEIKKAALDTVPNIAPLFWSFRIMVGLGIFFIVLFTYAFWLSTKRQFQKHPWFLRISLFSLPLPWVAAELGWFVAEHGRQPWTIEGILPTFLSASDISPQNVWISLISFVLFYSVLLVVDIFLMHKYVKLGPDLPYKG